MTRKYTVGPSRLAQWEEQRQEKMKRGLILLRMYNSGLNLSQIGRNVGVTRERVRQLLQYTGKYTRKYPIIPDFEFSCIHCGKKELLKGTMTNRRRRYCSGICGRKHYTVTRWGEGYVGVKKRTVEQKRLYYRERMHRYYHEVLKHRPDFHKKISQYNQNAKHTRKIWVEKNRDRINARIRERRLLKNNK